jgi:hypothetical protein
MNGNSSCAVRLVTCNGIIDGKEIGHMFATDGIDVVDSYACGRRANYSSVEERRPDGVPVKRFIVRLVFSVSIPLIET